MEITESSLELVLGVPGHIGPDPVNSVNWGAVYLISYDRSGIITNKTIITQKTLGINNQSHPPWKVLKLKVKNLKVLIKR